MRTNPFDLFGWGGALFRVSAEEDRGPLAGTRLALPRALDFASFVLALFGCFALFHAFKYLGQSLSASLPNVFPEELSKQLPFVLAIGAYKAAFGFARGIIATASQKRDFAPGEFWWSACIVATLSTVFFRELTGFLVGAGSRAAAAALAEAGALAGASPRAVTLVIYQSLSALIVPVALFAASYFAGAYLFRVVRGNLVAGYLTTFGATTALTLGSALLFASAVAGSAGSLAAGVGVNAAINALGLALGFVASKVSFERHVREG